MKMILQELFEIQNRISGFVPLEFRRYLKLPGGKRLLALTGSRGTGKTTLVMQYYLDNFSSTEECLYFSVDNPLVSRSSIYEIGKEYFTYYGNALLIDEVHKQKSWAIDVKALYDSFPDKQVIISGSSRLGIINQKGDLSRRAEIYNLKGLSFREFLEYHYGYKLEAYTLEEILTDHTGISTQISRKVTELKKYFQEYLHYGFYPFYERNNEMQYQQALLNIIDKIIYEDVPGLVDIKSSSSLEFKKLIAYLAMSKIPTVQVSSLCNELDITKETLYKYLDLLDRSEVINIVRERKASIRSIKKSRLLFLNPNLYYAVSSELWRHSTELGNIREAFFVSQINQGLYSSQTSDYEIDLKGKRIHIEIGGKNKSRSQIKDVDAGYLFKDDIVQGYENVIPLYLAGFLY
jgi:predicted AAA+ superfamily ATPase